MLIHRIKRLNHSSTSIKRVRFYTTFLMVAFFINCSFHATFGQSLSEIRSYLKTNLKYEKDSSATYLDQYQVELKHVNDSCIVAEYYQLFGQWNHFHGKRNTALSSLQKAKQIIDSEPRSAHSDSIRCIIYYSLADQYSYAGETKVAADISKQAVEICDQAVRLVDRSNSNYGAALNHLDIGAYAEALHYMSKTYALDLQSADSSLITADLNTMGKIAELMFDYKQANQYYFQSLRYVPQDAKSEALSLKKKLIRFRNIGTNYLHTTQFDSAYYFLNNSLELSAQVNDSLESGQCYAILADYHSRIGNKKEAISNGKKALSYYNENHERLQNSVELTLAATRSDHTSIETINRIIEYAKKIKDKNILARGYNLRSQVYSNLGQAKLALADLKTSQKMREERMELANNYQTEQLKFDTELLQNQHQIAKLEHQKIREEQRNELLVARGLAIGVGILGLLGALFVFFRYRSKLNVLALKSKQLEQEKTFALQLTEMQAETFRAQMNPHFMFNSLNSINKYILTNEPRIASKYLTKFAALMRLILDHAKERLVPIKDEIRSMELYMQLEQMRSKQSFDIEINLDKNLEHILVPPMLFQPFLENAIWHGLNQLRERRGKIITSISKEQEHVLIRVEDNGIGRKEAKALKTKTTTKKRISQGIKITKNRLQLIKQMHQAEASMSIFDIEEDHQTGTIVEIRIPLILEPKIAHE